MKVRSEGMVAICVASSDITALLLSGGRMVYSTFKIPINVNDSSFCSIEKNSAHANLICCTSLIIWDEVLIQHHHFVEAADRTLRDICDDQRSFRGITVVFSSDFCQTLPVVVKGSWEQIGNDVNKSKVAIPENIRVSPDLKSLIDAVYYNIGVEGICTNQYLKDWIILSSRNDDVDTINRTILNIFPENKQTYLSLNNVVIEEGADNIGNIYPVEYLNSLNPAGMPPSKLDLKIGCPIILFRNLSSYQGLCNGSRLVVTRLTDHIVEVAFYA
ncbi:5829_t:CDS:2, partial [Acaulospora morrowiae]